MMTGVAGDDVFGDLAEFELDGPLSRTDKAVTAAGWWRGREAIAKRLTSGERHWRKRFAHEVDAYRVFVACPPDWRVPELFHAGETVLVIERLPGSPPHTERYPLALPEPIVTGLLDALATFAAWRPPSGPLARQATDWAARVRRYVADGDLPAVDQDDLLAAIARAPVSFGHGDPLASNALVAADGRLTFIDFEFAGLYPVAADLALLGIWLSRHDPPAEQRCADAARAAGHLAAYRAMRVLWLAREQRLYRDRIADTDNHSTWIAAQLAEATATFRANAHRA